MGLKFKGYRFPSDLILLSVRWYLRSKLSYRDLEEMLEERGVFVDHTSVYRWVVRFTPLLLAAFKKRKAAARADRTSGCAAGSVG